MNNENYEYHYDLDDLCSMVYSETDYNKIMYGATVSGAFKDLTDEFDIPTDTEIHSDEVNELWCRHIVPGHILDTILISPKNIDDLEVKHFSRFMRLFIWKVRETYPKYKALLDNYNTAREHLMDPIALTTTTTNNLTNTLIGSTDSSVRFNDTPQNGGEFSADTYSSTFTKNSQGVNNTGTNTGTVTTTNENDGATAIARLEELRRYWLNIYVLWAREFDGLFIMD